MTPEDLEITRFSDYLKNRAKRLVEPDKPGLVAEVAAEVFTGISDALDELLMYREEKRQMEEMYQNLSDEEKKKFT